MAVHTRRRERERAMHLLVKLCEDDGAKAISLASRDFRNLKCGLKSEVAESMSGDSNWSPSASYKRKGDVRNWPPFPSCLWHEFMTSFTASVWGQSVHYLTNETWTRSETEDLSLCRVESLSTEPVYIFSSVRSKMPRIDCYIEHIRVIICVSPLPFLETSFQQLVTL